MISALFIYPIKSMAGISLSSMAFDALGAEYDRRYMLVDKSGQFISQRKYSQLALASITYEIDCWGVSIPQYGEKQLPKKGELQNEVAVQVWGDNFKAFDQGDIWAQWFSHWLGEEVRLVFIAEEKRRRIDVNYCEEERYVGFADGFPLLLCNEASLQALNTELEKTITIDRFRPNIVVSAKTMKAYEEDSWKTLAAENNAFDIVKPCSRCVIPTINIKTGETEKAVWQALSNKRKFDDGQVYFGQNIIHRSINSIAVGEEVRFS